MENGGKTLPKKLEPKEREKNYKLALRRYNHSELGKKTREKWLETEEGKKSVANANKKYVASGGLAKWLKTDKGRAYVAHVSSDEEKKRRKQVNFGVSEFIRDNRLLKGLTQAELASTIMVSTSLVTNWEQGRALPPYEKCLLMSEIFGVKYKNTFAPLLKEARRKSEESLK